MTVLHLGMRKQKIRWLRVVVEVDNDVWGKKKLHIESDESGAGMSDCRCDDDVSNIPARWDDK